MVIRRYGRVFGCVVALLGCATLLAQDGQPRPLTKEQQGELRAINAVISAAGKGQTAPNDLLLEWAGYDVLMKVLTDGHYTPFSVTMAPSVVKAKELTVYWRVVAKGTGDASDSAELEPERIAYEDMNTATVSPNSSQTIRRFFTVPAGEYVVQVVVKEPGDEKSHAKMSYITHDVTIPDYWNDRLTTSAVIVAESIEPLPVPLTPQQQSERPYALGPLRSFQRPIRTSPPPINYRRSC